MAKDPYNRLYHDQYRNNSGINARGVHMDTLEVFLSNPPGPSQKPAVEAALRAWAGDRLVALVWSRDALPVLELKAGYFQPADLEPELVALGLSAAELRGYYAARLDELVNRAAGKHRF